LALEIVELRLEHEHELAGFVAEFAAANEDRIPAFLPDASWSFHETVDGFANQSRGEDLPEGWVPGTTRFLVHEGRMLGLFNLRHWLTDELLRFGGHVGYSVRPSERCKGYGTCLLEAGMEMARELNIDRILVTCDPTNIGSAKVIMKCGGVLEEKFLHEPVGHEVFRYWITLA
jgi:predicted acetyltransferase